MQKIIVLHGWGQSKQQWQSLIDIMSTDYDIEAIDLPGFGAEALVSPDWSVPHYAQWVKQRIEQLNYTDVILLGHSFGGRIAAYIAGYYQPKWLKSVILYGAPVLYRPSMQVQFKNQLFKLGKALPRSVKDLVKSEELKQADTSGLGKVFRNVVVFDQTETLKQIYVPVYLLWGEDDTEAKVEIARIAANLIPDSKLYILPANGHNIHIENQPLFYGTLKRILNTN
jgi:pimeloyl-ACP methyl ester carboxylesterase